MDFTVEVERSLRVLDGAVVVFDGVAGVEPQSETVWRQADRYGVPRICFINKLDRTGADFWRGVESIKERLGANAVPVQIPIGAGGRLPGRDRPHRDEGHRLPTTTSAPSRRSTEIPAELLAEAEKHRAAMIEAVAELDDELTMKFLEGEELDARRDPPRPAPGHAAEPHRARCSPARPSRTRACSPCSTRSCTTCPRPLDVPPITGIDADGNEVTRAVDDKEPFAALAFKIAADPFVGKLAFFRVYSGKLKTGSYVYNASKGKRERIGRIVELHANSREEIDGGRRRRHRRRGRPQGDLHRRHPDRSRPSRDPRVDDLPRAGHRGRHRAQDQG